MTDVTERAINAGSATRAAEFAAATAVEYHEDHPSQYRAGVAAAQVGLYGWVLAAEHDAWADYAAACALAAHLVHVPTRAVHPGGGGVPDGAEPARSVASGVACGPGGVPAGVSRAAPHPTRPDR